MTKIKTNRGAAKRFIKTKGGFKHKASHRRHLLSHKDQKRKRQLRGAAYVKKMDQLSIHRLLNGS